MARAPLLTAFQGSAKSRALTGGVTGMAILLQRLLQAIHLCLQLSQAAPDGNQVDKKDAPDKQIRRHHATQILQHGALLISVSLPKRAGPPLLTAPPAWTVSARDRRCGVLLRQSFLRQCGATTRAGTAGAAARSTLRAALPSRSRRRATSADPGPSRCRPQLLAGGAASATIGWTCTPAAHPETQRCRTRLTPLRGARRPRPACATAGTKGRGPRAQTSKSVAHPRSTKCPRPA